MRSRFNFFLFKDWSSSCALPALIARIAVGYVFFISGLGKLLHLGPDAATLDYALPIFQLIFGAFLFLGFLTLISSALLFLNMVIAVSAVRFSNFWMGIGAFFYIPEALLALLLFWLMFAGGGKWSIDHLIGGRNAHT